MLGEEFLVYFKVIEDFFLFMFSGSLMELGVLFPSVIMKASFLNYFLSQVTWNVTLSSDTCTHISTVVSQYTCAVH